MLRFKRIPCGNMFTGSVIVMLVVFASQDGSVKASTSSPLITATPTAAASATVSSTASDKASATASATALATASNAASAPSSDTASATASATPSSSSSHTAASQTVAPTPTSSGSIEAGGSASVTMSSTSVTPTETPQKTCADISVEFKEAWNESYANNKSRSDMQMLMNGLYNDSRKYTHVQISDLTFKKKEGKVQLAFKLCLVIYSGFIEDVFVTLVKTGIKLSGGEIEFEVVKGSVEFKAVGVKFTGLKAKEGECKKCSEGGGGPFDIEGKCEAKAGYSCEGLKSTQKSSDCVKYCGSSDAAIIFPSVVVALGIILSLSFNIWK